MRITDLLDKRSINLNAAPQIKSEALDMAVELMAKSGKIDDIESYRAKVYAREEESTTGVRCAYILIPFVFQVFAIASAYIKAL